MLIFAALGALAALTLTDERVRNLTLLLLCFFAFKTWLQHRRRQREAANDASE
jgi:uncharacterized membrane protein YfcA